MRGKAGMFSQRTTSDPYFSSVSLLLHLDGTNGSTTFTDSSSNALSLSPLASGSTTISTADSKFGGASMYVNNDSSAGFGLSVATNSVIQFGGSDFVLEFWLKTNAGNPGFLAGFHPSTFSGEAPNATEFILAINWPDYGRLAVLSSDFATLSTANISINNNAWHHVSVVRNGGTLSIYKDGDSVASQSITGSFSTSSRLFQLGGATNWAYHTGYTCYIDDFRVTIGSARGYAGSTIAVPTAAFPNS